MQDITTFLQQHWQLSLAFLIILSVLMILEFVSQQRGTLKLSTAQATQLINRSNARVIDVRSATDYAQGHIIDAISLPLADLKDKIKKIEKYKSTPIILVCQTGIESPRAADTLKNVGFNIHVLQGGMRAWRDAEMPIVKG